MEWLAQGPTVVAPAIWWGCARCFKKKERACFFLCPVSNQGLLQSAAHYEALTVCAHVLAPVFPSSPSYLILGVAAVIGKEPESPHQPAFIACKMIPADSILKAA